MADRPIDRAAWARLVEDLIQTESRGKKATFARLVGVDPTTIRNWLAGNVGVSESSVRRVATALGRNPIDLLVQVGYYRADEVTPSLPPSATDDPVLQQILEADVPPRMKFRMLQRLEDRRTRQREVEAEEVRFWIEQAKGA